MVMDAEGVRVRVLNEYGVLDTQPEERFDRLTRLAAELFNAPISLITLLDGTRNWFKSHYGWDKREGPRAWAFCEHLSASAPSTILVVTDAASDPRFAANPYVIGPPNIRFYAGTPLAAPDGTVLGTFCVIDTSPRAHPTERELHLLRTLADLATDELELSRRIHQTDERAALLDMAGTIAGIGTWRYDVETQSIAWSDELYAMHGVTRKDFDPDTNLGVGFFVPEDQLTYRYLLARALQHGEDYTVQLRLKRADGVLRQVTCKATCRRDDKGRVTAVIGVLQDVTDSAEAARRVEESERRFRIFAEHACEMVSFVDRGGARTYVSPAARHILGLEPDEVIEKGFLHLVYPEDYADLLKLREDLLDGHVLEKTVTFRANVPSRGKIWVETTAQALRDPRTGAPDGYFSVSRDITDRKAVLEALIASEERLRLNTDLQRLASDLTKARDLAEKSNEAKSRFLTSISHELRTPLNGILGYAQLLRQGGNLSEAQAGWVETMLSAGEHLLAMINNVLDMAEIETKHVALRPEPTNLHNLVRMCIDLIRPAAEKKQLALIASIAGDTPGVVLIDVTRLRQIMLNLLGNAVKYTPSGAVEIRLRTEQNGEVLRLDVLDTGPGIPPSRRSSLFKDFERLAVASASAVEGTGLGLAISAKLASVMGGQVGYTERPGGGSIFWLELPCVAAGPAAQPQVARNDPAPPASHACRVLVVDDTAMNRDIASALLRTAGHQVTCAAGGIEAVDMIAHEDFDVVLMDVRMPEVDGLEATRRVRALPGPRAKTPIIALTAQSFVAQIGACHAAGMNLHLAKPYTCQGLLDIVGQAARLTAGLPDTRAYLAEAPPPDEADLPICDTAIYDRTTALLTPDAVHDHVKTLAARSEEVLRLLRQPAGISSKTADLAAAAHMLAGSAGMLGFRRLSASARQFEAIIVQDLAGLDPATQGLTDVLESTLEDMRSRIAA